MKDEKSSKKGVLLDSTKSFMMDSLIENELKKFFFFLQRKLPKDVGTELNQNDEAKCLMSNFMFHYFVQNYNKLIEKNPCLVDNLVNMNEMTASVCSGMTEKKLQEQKQSSQAKTSHGELNVSFFTENMQCYPIVRCSIKDNIIKPRTVSDLSLAINLPASECLPFTLLYQAVVECLFKNILTEYYMDVMEEEIKILNENKKKKGTSFSDAIYIEALQKKMKELGEENIDFESPLFQSKYSMLFDVLAESIKKLNRGNILNECQQQLKTAEEIIDLEHLRDKNFSMLAKELASIVDSSLSGYQYIENIKGERILILREYECNYEDKEDLALPDERYQLALSYCDHTKLAEKRRMYRDRVFACANKIDHLLSVVDTKLYGDAYSVIINSMEDLQKHYKTYVEECESFSSKMGEDSSIKKGSFFLSSVLSKDDKTFESIKNDIRKNFEIIQQRIQEIYGGKRSVDREVLEERFSLLKDEERRIDSLVHPFYLTPGFLLEVSATSIKRRCITFTALQSVISTWIISFEKLAVLAKELFEKKKIAKKSVKKERIETEVIEKEIVVKTQTTQKENKKKKMESTSVPDKLTKTEKIEKEEKIAEDENAQNKNERKQEGKNQINVKKEKTVVKNRKKQNVEDFEVTEGEGERKKVGAKKEEERKNIKRRNKNPKQKNLFREI